VNFYQSKRVHGPTSQKTAIFILTTWLWFSVDGVWSFVGMAGENGNTPREMHLFATLHTTNPALTTLGLKPCLKCKKIWQLIVMLPSGQCL
jgi:hypothetical protein